MRRKALFLLLALGAAAGAAVYRLRASQPRVRVDVYFEDGSVETLADGPDAARLVSLARDVRTAS